MKLRSVIPAWVAWVPVGILAVLLGYREIYGPDVGFHLESGRRVLERGVQVRDDLTWTDGSRRYVDLEWLWQAGMYGMFRLGGTLWLVLSNIALTLGALAIAALRSVRREGRMSAAVSVWLFLFAMANLWEIRPHAASWLLLGLVLLVLEERRRGARRLAAALPLILLVWVNVHSLYVLGLVAIGIHALVALREDPRSARGLVVAGLLALAACCINPFGTEALLFPIRQLWEISGRGVFNRPDLGVVEFRPPWSLEEYTANGELVLLQPVLFLQLAGVLAAGIVLVGRRRLELADFLILAAYGFTFWQAQKNFGYFLLAALPALVGAAGMKVPHRLRLVPWAVPVACAIVALQWKSGWLYAHQHLPHRSGHAFNERFLPVRVCAFLSGHVPRGRLLNHWDHGGYVSFATRQASFIDARTEVMGEKFFAEYRKLFDPATFDAEIMRWRPEIALVPIHAAPLWQARLSANPAWRLVYADEQDFVYLENGFAPEVPALAPARAPLPDPARIDAALGRAISLHGPRFFGTLHGSHYDPLVELRWTASWLLRARPEAALAQGIPGLERMTLPAPRLLYNVMMALLQEGDLTRALRCYDTLPSSLRDPVLGRRLRRALQGR